MDEQRFWECIEQSRFAHNQHQCLRERLSMLAPEEIIAFELHLRDKMAKAYTSDMMAANFVIRCYISDDEFEEFRAWLVSHGRERFEAALNNVESIADWLRPEDVDDINGMDMLLVAQKAYTQYGDEEAFANAAYRHPDMVFDPDIDVELPQSRDELQHTVPRLFQIFWDPDKIQEYHTYDM
jgi:hypothetical protein